MEKVLIDGLKTSKTVGARSAPGNPSTSSNGSLEAPTRRPHDTVSAPAAPSSSAEPVSSLLEYPTAYSSPASSITQPAPVPSEGNWQSSLVFPGRPLHQSSLLFSPTQRGRKRVSESPGGGPRCGQSTLGGHRGRGSHRGSSAPTSRKYVTRLHTGSTFEALVEQDSEEVLTTVNDQTSQDQDETQTSGEGLMDEGFPPAHDPHEGKE